jgi:tetratricopeptide (TPR) repeat protein
MNLRSLIALALLAASGWLHAEMAPDVLARYRQDLETLAEQLPKRHANVAHTTPRADFDREVEQLRAQLAEMDEAEALVALARISTLPRDGHTALFLLPFPGGPKVAGISQLPIQFYAFEDGLRVIAIERAHRDLLGATLTAVGDVPVAELRRRIVELVPQDNEMGRLEYTAWYAALPEVLHAVGAAPERGRARLQFKFGTRTKTVELAAMTSAPDAGWATQLITLPGERADWVAAGGDSAKPRWLRDSAKPYWHERDADGLVYAQINLLRDAGGQSFADFATELLKQVPNDDTARLVLDLRFNRGGDGDLIWPMIYGLIRHDAVNRPGRLFVITGRRTFSAAQMFANALEKHTRAIFVGEPTGSSPNHYGEVGQIKLAGTGLTAIYSQYYYQHHPADRRPWIPPHLYAPLRFEDLAAGRDPAMAAIAAFAPPPNAVALLQPKLDAGDAEGALAAFAAATRDWRNPWRNLFEVELNDYGYELLGERRFADAITVLGLVTELYPESANAWDSLGEAHALAGQRARASYCYARSLRLNPDNAHGADQLDALLGH